MRVAVLIKQIPQFEEMRLGPDGRLDRAGVALEMNPYCRRAVSKGVELAAAGGGECVVFTLGPAAADDCLREAIAWGASRGVHLCDPEFAGSDTLATATALAAAIRAEGSFDLILAGKCSVDADTGQVGPELAQLLGLPMLSGVREMTVHADTNVIEARCEGDDGHQLATTVMPAVITTAERLCEPAKVPPAQRAEVDSDLIRVVRAADLGIGPWGASGSPTVVGETRAQQVIRRRVVTHGAIEEQVVAAVAELNEHGLLDLVAGAGHHEEALPAARPGHAGRMVAVLLEDDRDEVGRELLGQAAILAAEVSGHVVAMTSHPQSAATLGSWGADVVLPLEGSVIEEDIAHALVGWCASNRPWALIVPGTISGREIASRVAAELRLGLTGDAIDITVEGHTVVAWKPAFGGQLVAAITSLSDIQAVTVRPGVLPLRRPRAITNPEVLPTLHVPGLSRTKRLEVVRDDDVDVLSRADTVIAVGRGVPPESYPDLEPLRKELDAELAATRKVTDKGWLPRSRQVGITGRSIRPRLFISVGASGRFNHMVGARGAHFVLAINNDPKAEIFETADRGIVGDWREVVPALAAAIAASRSSVSADGPVPTGI